MADVTTTVTAKTAPGTASPIALTTSLPTAPSAAEAITGGADYGFTQAQANAILINLLDIRTILKNAGLCK